MKQTSASISESLRDLARLQVRMDLARTRQHQANLELAVTDVLSFIRAQPEVWRDAQGGLLDSERVSRLAVMERYSTPGVRSYLAEKNLSAAEFCDAYQDADRRAFVLAVLDASERG